jgi:tetratricopeptide (TPR) repeat protein
MPEVLADDRSGLYVEMIQVREQEHNDAAVKSFATEWLNYLETEAARATTPDARSAFDGFLLSAARKLKDPARAIPALQASERDLPKDVNPPLRLARAYTDLGQYDKALSELDRAWQRAYGSERLQVLDVRAAVFEKQHQKPEARKALQDALQIAATLPPDLVRPWSEMFEARLKQLN